MQEEQEESTIYLADIIAMVMYLRPDLARADLAKPKENLIGKVVSHFCSVPLERAQSIVNTMLAMLLPLIEKELQKEAQSVME
jgi:hypothetical protein